ncbi:amidohydrolase family protein [Candidatus Latescibacterota bacterium]
MSDRTFFRKTNRRNVLKYTGVIAAALPLSSGSVFSAGSNITDIVDCHFHLWARDKKRFPYSEDPPYAPDYSSTADQWDKDRIGAGISKGIFVLGAPYKTDHSFLFHSLELAPDSLRGVCIVDPNVPEGIGILEKIVSEHNIVGVRLQTSWLWGVDWGSPYLEAFWKKVGDLDIVLQMHLEPEHTYEFEKLVKKYPGTRVVIDHLGRPRDGDAVDYLQLLEISAYPHVYMKLSSFDTESRQEPPHDKVRPLINLIVDRFTTRKLVWGSNNYRGGMGSEAYLGLVQLARGLFDFLSIDEQKRIFIENPRRLYKIT